MEHQSKQEELLSQAMDLNQIKKRNLDLSYYRMTTKQIIISNTMCCKLCSCNRTLNCYSSSVFLVFHKNFHATRLPSNIANQLFQYIHKLINITGFDI